MKTTLDELVKLGVNKDYDTNNWDNPVFVIDTDQAPKDEREFPKYVRRTIELIMREVKRDIVVNDDFEVQVSGELSEKYVKTAQRLGRKAECQAEIVREELLATYSQPVQTGSKSFRNLVNIIVGGIAGRLLFENGFTIGVAGGYAYDNVCEGAGTRLVNQARSAIGLDETELGRTSRNSLKSLINTVVGGIIGYSVSPEYPVFATTAGAFIGNNYNGLVEFLEYPVRAVFNEARRVTFDEMRLNRRYPLAKRAEDYRRFGSTIGDGFVSKR